MRIAFEEEKAGAHPTKKQIRAYYQLKGGNTPLVLELAKANPCPILHFVETPPDTLLIREKDGVVTASWIVFATDFEAAKNVAQRIDDAINETCGDYLAVTTYMRIAKKLKGGE